MHAVPERDQRAARASRRTAEVSLVEDHPATRMALDAAASMASIADPECEAGRRELSQLVQVTLDHLPGRYGHVLEWRYIQGLSVDEIAHRLGVGYKAAESLLSRARQSFRDAFSIVAGTWPCRRRVARLDRGGCDGGHRCERPRPLPEAEREEAIARLLRVAGMRADVPPDQQDRVRRAVLDECRAVARARVVRRRMAGVVVAVLSAAAVAVVAVRLGLPRETTPAVAARVAAVERLEGSGGRLSSGSGSTRAPIRLADTVRIGRSDRHRRHQPCRPAPLGGSVRAIGSWIPSASLVGDGNRARRGRPLRRQRTRIS